MKKYNFLIFLFLSLFLFSSFGCSKTNCNHSMVIDEYVQPTCDCKGLTQGAHCLLCGETIIRQEKIDPLGHSWELVELVNATESREGMARFCCPRCGYAKEETLPKLEHTHQFILCNGVGASCESDGQIEHYECHCGKHFVYRDNDFVEIEREDIVVPKSGHSISRIKEEDIPHFEYDKCSNCGQVFEYVLPSIRIMCDDEVGLDYSTCEISTDNCSEQYVFCNVPAQIKVRGNWTSTLEKKPYRLKFEKKRSMLGLNHGLKAKSWVLLADYADKSMVRSAAGFYIANQIYGDNYYSSDCCFVEIYINGTYQGVYLLAEQQQVHEGRIDIFEDKNNDESDIGYFIEYDRYYWKEDPSIVFDIEYDPIPYFNGVTAGKSDFIEQYVVKSNLNNQSQKTFIKNRLQDIWNIAYDALYGDHSDLVTNPFKTINDNGDIVDDISIHSSYDALERLIDIESLVDTYLFNEIVQDMDVGWSSFYLSLDMSEFGSNKLVFQAPWDFDWCFGNSVNNIHQLYLGNYLSSEPNQEKSNPWLLLVSNEQWFWQLIQDKWSALNSQNLKSKLLSFIAFFTNNFINYVEKEYDRWPDKEQLVVWCSSENTLSARTQLEDSMNVSSYINKRFEWLDFYFGDISRVKPWAESNEENR